MTRRRFRANPRVLIFAACVLLAAPVLPAVAGEQPMPREPEDRIAAAFLHGGPTTPSGVTLQHFKLLGHHDLGADVDFGDVWGFGNFAYIGTRCGPDIQGGAGVRVVDISDPTNPVLVSTLGTPEFTRAEDVVVRHVSTPSFTGDLAAVGIQLCFGSGHASAITGLRFYNVTDAAHPTEVGEWDLHRAVGCHEIDLVQRADETVLAGCARNLVDQENGSVGVHVVDATNPADPQEISTFSLDVNPVSGVGCFPVQFAHSVRFTEDGQTMYVSYWDAGTVNVDLSDPTSPTEVATTQIVPPDSDGDNHSMTLANGGTWMVINQEDDSPVSCPGHPEFDGFGKAWVFDNSDPANPTLLGTFATDDAASHRMDGIFTIHNTEAVLGTQFFSSWYTDGIVWWTMDDTGRSRQVGQFVPPATVNGPAFVWGVFPDSEHDLILGSDFITGLWIVKPVGLEF